MIGVSSVWPLKPRIEFPAIRLTSPRIVMRPPDLVDWQDWAALRDRNRDHLIPFEPQWPGESLSREIYTRRLKRQARDWKFGLSCSFLIFKSDDQVLIGGLNLNNIARGAAQFCTLGYWLGAEYEGAGYMSEALRLAMTYGFDTLEFHRINAATLPHNGRSIKLLRRHGFEEEGFAKSYLQINGAWQDHILFGITADHFRKGIGVTV